MKSPSGVVRMSPGCNAEKGSPAAKNSSKGMAMAGRIITARHGKPDLSRDMLITAREYGQWWQSYDQAGLIETERPPAALVALSTDCSTIMSSTLLRAIETAQLIAGEGRGIPQDAIFVEANLPPPPLPFIRMRPGWWGGLSRTCWVLGYNRGGYESQFACWKRVHKIVERLTGAAREGDVMLCAHGYINWMIHRHLMKTTKYRLVEHEGGNKHWSWRLYEME